MASNLVNKSLEEITQIRARARTKEMETFTAIKDYYMGADPVILSDTQENIRRRWHAVYLKKLDRRSDADIVRNLQGEFGISQSQAYQDLNNSKRLFGVTGKSDRDLNRQVAEEMAKDTFQVAKEQRDAKGMAAASRVFVDASGIKDDMSDLPDFSKLEPNVYVMMLDSKTQQLLDKLLTKPVINLSDIMNEMAEDADIETTG